MHSRRSPGIEPTLLQTVRKAHLHYAMDDRPGIQRKRSGKHFRYVDTQGRTIRDPDEIARLRRLAIPPAWRDVWICPDPNGHMQATGRDARGRKQYRYHPRWREVRDETKYDRMIAFGLRAAAHPRAHRQRPARGRACRARRCSPRWCGCSRAR